MDPETDDETSETSSQSQQGSEQTPSSKLRDLRPEKDPMGGVNADGQDSQGAVSAN